jgi:hypothetical protein
MLIYKVGEKNDAKRCFVSDIDLNQVAFYHLKPKVIQEIALLS